MKNKTQILLLLVLALLASCSPASKKQARVERFFADDSFWNTPIPSDAEADPKSDHLIGLMKKDPSGFNFGINTDEYTIPVYEADGSVPLVKMKLMKGRRGAGQSKEFQEMGVPIPVNFAPSPGTDMHATIIDRDRGLAWDMFYVLKDSTGEWASYTGMVVDLRGSGVFDPADFPVKDGESIHQYGPSRAAGVPSFAGLIMYDEAAKGEINHKLACALRCVGYGEHIYPPAVWTDGNLDNGVPEGAVIQLDPNLDLSQFDLLPGDRAVAVALQKYGAVVVDFAGGNCLYAEGLWVYPEKSWKGLLRGWGDYNGTNGIASIPLDHYRVLKMKNIRTGGDRKKTEFFAPYLKYFEGDGCTGGE